MINTLTIIGRTTKDLTNESLSMAGGIRTVQTKNGPMTVFSLPVAVDTGRKDAQGNDVTNFFDFDVRGATADNLLKYAGKGSLIGITGHLAQDRWVDKETGKNRSRVRLVADRVEYLSMKKPGGAPTNANGYGANNGAPVSGGYGAPANGGYGSAPANGGYGNAPAGTPANGYNAGANAAPANGGYNGYGNNGYANNANPAPTAAPYGAVEGQGYDYNEDDINF